MCCQIASRTGRTNSVTSQNIFARRVKTLAFLLRALRNWIFFAPNFCRQVMVHTLFEVAILHLHIMENRNGHFEIKKFVVTAPIRGGKVDPLWVQSPPPLNNCSIIARKKKDCKIYLFSRPVGERSRSHRAFVRTKVRWRPLAPKISTREFHTKFKKSSR